LLFSLLGNKLHCQSVVPYNVHSQTRVIIEDVGYEKVKKASVIHSMHVTYDHTQPSKQAKPHGIHICIHEYC
jgi:hypothetical protein